MMNDKMNEDLNKIPSENPNRNSHKDASKNLYDDKRTDTRIDIKNETKAETKTDRKNTAEEIAQLPLMSCPVPFYIVPSEVALAEMCEALAKEPIIGFDTETKPAFKPGQKFAPSLMQLSGARAVYLIQLPQLKNIRPLQTLLELPNLKVGVGVGEDLRRLLPYFDLRKRNRGAQFIDLTFFARSKGLTVGSLRGLAAELLKKRLSKGAQLTNWANPHLSYNQLRYAAIDAWAGREIFLKLQV
jgi:hypothetical protein